MPLNHTPGPVAWQRFGNEYCLTGQYGIRPIILSVGRKGLQLRDAKRDLLIPFDPSHEDARFIERAFNCHDELLAACKLFCDWCETPDQVVTPEVIEAIHSALEKAEAA